jgi:hypothetical protein
MKKNKPEVVGESPDVAMQRSVLVAVTTAKRNIICSKSLTKRQT